MSQLSLVVSRRLGPLFWVQFLGAFNDNLFKNLIVLLITYQGLMVHGISPSAMVPLSAGLFILPFFLFSGQAGQLADRFSKTRVVQITKGLELGIMAIGALGLVQGRLPLLWVALFLMGAQSAFFGPAKYSILRELVEARDLNAANALIELGTFLAILLGTIAAGALVALKVPLALAGLAVIAVAVSGTLVSLVVPMVAPAAPSLRWSLNPIPSLWDTIQVSRKERSVYLAILGISWFWFLGATLLSILPLLGKDALGLGEGGVTFFLAVFCVGIALGAMLSERLGGHKMELGLVPLGSFLLSVGLLDWGYNVSQFAPVPGATLEVRQFLAIPGGARIALDLGVVALAGGLFTVPLYTLLQERTAENERGRVIAGNNVLNALFMVGSAGALLLFNALEVPSWAVLVVLAFMNLAVAVYIYSLVPEFLLRFLAWCLAHGLYRLQVRGAAQVPERGAALLTPNHVSYVDWLLLATVTQRPIRFVMYYKFHQLPVLGFVFRHARVIPIASKHEDPQVLERAMEEIRHALRAGELVCIFPEGALTDSGELLPFKPGVLKVLQEVPVPVIPVGIVGMWGSFFSRKDKQALRRPFRRFWSRVRLEVGEPLPAGAVTLPSLEAEVARLSGASPRAVAVPDVV